MPTSTSITTTYAGQFSGKYIAAALLAAPTLDKELVTIKPNIKYKDVIKTFSNTQLIFDAACDFTPTSTVTLNEKILQPEEFQVNLQLCKKDFRSDWEAIEMGISVYDNLPPTFTDFLIAQAAGQVAQALETNIWSGSNAASGQFAGFVNLVSGSGTGAIQVFGAAQVSSSNVVAELQRVVDAIPNSVYGKEDLAIYVPTNVVKAYQTAVGNIGTGYLNQTVIGQKPLDFQGIPLAFCPGMPSNTIIAAQKSNLYFGTGLLDDRNEVKILDMGDLDGSQNVRVIMRYTAAVQIGIAADIVYYGRAI
jgi:hypothetical protein